MANATFVINCIILFESLLIFSGNSFTIFVFWKNRNKLKRTSFLLINLAVADLLVGLSQMIMTGGFYIPDSLQTNITSGEDNLKHLLLSIQHLSFPFTSVFFLVLISLSFGRFAIEQQASEVIFTAPSLCGVLQQLSRQGIC